MKFQNRTLDLYRNNGGNNSLHPIEPTEGVQAGGVVAFYKWYGTETPSRDHRSRPKATGDTQQESKRHLNNGKL